MSRIRLKCLLVTSLKNPPDAREAVEKSSSADLEVVVVVVAHCTFCSFVLDGDVSDAAGKYENIDLNNFAIYSCKVEIEIMEGMACGTPLDDEGGVGVGAEAVRRLAVISASDSLPPASS